MLLRLFSNLQNRSNEKGVALISSLLIVLILSVFLAMAMISSQNQLMEVRSLTNTQEAFYAADNGIQRALFEFRSNPDWLLDDSLDDEQLTVTIDDESETVGFYSLDIIDAGNYQGLGSSRWVRSTGWDAMRQVSRIIVARILIINPTQYLFSSPGTLEVRSGANINSDILANRIHFEVNASLPEPMDRIMVDGDVNYVQAVNPADPDAHPSISITGRVQKFPTITFPGVDTELYQSIAQSQDSSKGYYYDGHLTVELDQLGNLNPEPGFQPEIIYASGDITVSGEYAHSLLIVAEGNIFIVDDLAAREGEGLPEENAPQLGLFAKKDVLIPDGAFDAGEDVILHGNIVADGAGDAHGVFAAQSSVGLGTLNFRGSISVRGDDDAISVDLNAFAVRDYQHQPNTGIPFTPYIANIVRWRESHLNEAFPLENE